ncbi:hypothetical protein TrVE_jg10260 [Triparma verrucosa]|uniref:JmjC domain-containing protein n=1 Tax=Triparma verrucosa TaxID=1606542 RepID=A0A9W7C3A5_9STRA|nr:hypothetical protein TrVE_jg10260 [Triparma verrucosa]
MGYTSRIEKLRTEHRPYLDSWNGEHIYKRFASYRDSLSLRHAKPEDILRPDPAFSNLPGQVPNPSMDATSNVKEPLQTPISPGHDYLKQPPRCLPLCVDRSKLESLDDYKALNLPVLIRNIPQHEDWDCCKNSSWDLSSLSSSFPKAKLKCGEDDDGEVLRVSLKDFNRYVNSNLDDSPLYIFDSRILEQNSTIRSGYSTPSYFSSDLWSNLKESKRPPYKWFLIAPERSGTTIHTDPLETSAWNTVITGKKRWVLFPPSVKKELVKAKNLFEKSQDDEAANYFMHVLEKIRTLHPSIPCYEFTQNPKETLYVPSGWWHGVLNLECGVGVTMNFCDEFNFDKVWREAREGRPRSCWRWLEGMVNNDVTIRGEGVADRVERLNKEDGWVREEYLQRKKEKKERKKERKAKKKEAKRRKKEGGDVESDADMDIDKDSEGEDEQATTSTSTLKGLDLSPPSERVVKSDPPSSITPPGSSSNGSSSSSSSSSSEGEVESEGSDKKERKRKKSKDKDSDKWQSKKKKVGVE